MNQDEFKNDSRSRYVQDKMKKLTKEKSKKIISDVKKKVSPKQNPTKETTSTFYRQTTLHSASDLFIDSKVLLDNLCERPCGLTEVRRDGKDTNAVIRVIKQEFKRCKEKNMPDAEVMTHMQTVASTCWVSTGLSLTKDN